MITQGELKDHSSNAHNFKTVKCEVRDLNKIDVDLLNSLNHGRGSVIKPKFESISEFENSIDALEDHSWERSLRNQSKNFNSIIGRNVTGVQENHFIQPGGVHIIIGNYSSNFGQETLF